MTPSREAFLAQIEEPRRRVTDRIPVRAERWRSEVALRGSYRALYDNIPLMCFTLEASGRVLAVNPFGVEELGYSAEEMVGESVLKVFHPDDRQAVEQQLDAALQQPGQVAKWRFRKVRKDGTMLWVQETVRVVEEGGRTIVLVVCEDVTERVEARQKLERYQHKLQALTSELALAEERERRRIAEGLHDQIGQVLALAKLRHGVLRTSEDPAARAQSIEEIGPLLDQALQETRSLAFELSCPILYRLGLEAAVQDLGKRLGRQTGVRFLIESDSQPKPLTEDVKVTLFRVVQELLVNIVKHARVRNARLAISRVGDDVQIKVEDDGVGFDSSNLGESPSGGLGLFSVRERLDHLGGGVEIDSSPGGGTRMVVVAPLAPQELKASP